MASCVCRSSVLVLSFFFVLLCANGDVNLERYAYSHNGELDTNIHFELLSRERRDLSGPATTSVSAQPADPDAADKGTYSINKGEDKFPDTKKPIPTGKPSKPEKPEKKPIKKKPFDKKPNKEDSIIVAATSPDSVAAQVSSGEKKDEVLPTNNSTASSNTPITTSSSSSTTSSSTTSSTPAPSEAVIIQDKTKSDSEVNTSTVTRYDNDFNDTDDLAVEDDAFPQLDNTTEYKTNNSQSFAHHRYYKSLTFSGDEMQNYYWVNMDGLSSNISTESKLLSNAHRQAFTLSLSFIFPFYGHRVQNITIATGGFLYTGDILHTWLAATQYIAPLMANFDTSASEDSKVRYADNGTALTVQWENVYLKDNVSHTTGPFTFQVTIHESGDIVFSYKDIPMSVDAIADTAHPVKVGLSDAYIVQKTIFYVRRKTIYEYHKIDMKKPDKISNTTAIVFKALPTCISYPNCSSCLRHNSTFQCRWCSKVGRCSDGTDRFRQEWLLSRCDFFNTMDPLVCSHLPSNPSPYHPTDTHDPDAAASAKARTSEPDDGVSSNSVGGTVAVALIICLVFSVVSWLAYAYFYPHTTSGQLLIKYRPSTWSFRRGGAGYTAAAMHSIHM